jgi:CRISPR-associated protein Cmr3
MNPSFFVVQPRDTALFRDARPFEAGSSAWSMPLPWPSTLAGLLRTQSFLDNGGAWTGDPATARQVETWGPWIAELAADGKVLEHYVPAPMDAVFFRREVGGVAEWHRHRLRPEPPPAALQSDIPASLHMLTLTQGADGTAPDGKTSSGPAFWSWRAMQAWLQAPPARAEHMRDDSIHALGIDAPPSEERVHVSIDGDTGTADDGKLFGTSMRRWSWRDRRGNLRHFAIVGGVRDTSPRTGLVTFGGERRLSSFRVLEGDALRPAAWSDGATILRVVLVTPGIFDKGWRPGCNGALTPGRLVAAMVPRPESVSGWDWEHNRPKPARRMVPAGAVYWVKFDAPQAARDWADSMHLGSIADQPQDRLDGFGRIVIGREA